VRYGVETMALREGSSLDPFPPQWGWPQGRRDSEERAVWVKNCVRKHVIDQRRRAPGDVYAGRLRGDVALRVVEATRDPWGPAA
jgi:hypothetical protein